jgi:hypothetical protein
MNLLTSVTLFAALLAALVGAGLAYALTRSAYAAKLRDADARLERMQKGRIQANDLLLQARRQTEMLRKELEIARRLRAPAALPAAEPPTAAAEEAPVGPISRPASGFADTLPLVV